MNEELGDPRILDSELWYKEDVPALELGIGPCYIDEKLLKWPNSRWLTKLADAKSHHVKS